MVIFDLDGTLAINDHRRHFIERPVGEKDWTAFFDACDGDTLNTPVMDILREMGHGGWDVRIWTGRTERVREKTVLWLNQNGLGRIPLKMRPEGDHRPDVVLKAEWIEQSDPKPYIAFEDRDSVVEMWRSHGILCCQVARGDF